jgi:molybdate transport system substrate-binding protein
MRERWMAVLAAGLAVALLGGCGSKDAEKPPAEEAAGEASLQGTTLELFVGSASMKATQEAADRFEEKTGCRVLLHFGGSGKMLSDMELAERGDLYFPGSSDFMELAKRKGLVVPETEKIVVYLIPAINVPAENPKGIETLEDLAKPRVRVAIANPKTVCVGLYAVEVLTHNGLADRVKPNIVKHATSCSQTASLVALGSVDAILGWRVFQYWNPEKIKTILLPREQVPRVGYIPIARSRYCEQPEAAQAFVDFLLSEEGKAIFRKWHYLITEEEARQLAAPDAQVGGEWQLPEGW